MLRLDRSDRSCEANARLLRIVDWGHAGKQSEPLKAIPQTGPVARVRQRLDLVESTKPPQKAGEGTLVSLSCVDDDAQGQPLEVLWEREIDRAIITGEVWPALLDRGVLADPASPLWPETG